MAFQMHPLINFRQNAATPFAVHYEKIRNHLRETAINYAKRHSLAKIRTFAQKSDSIAIFAF